MSENSNLFGQLKKEIEQARDVGILREEEALVREQTRDRIDKDRILKEEKERARQEEKKRRIQEAKAQKRRLTRRNLIELALIFVAAVSAAFLIISLGLDYKSEKAMEELRNVVKTAKLQSVKLRTPVKIDGVTPVITETANNTDYSVAEDEEASLADVFMAGAYGIAPELSQVYADLYERNENYYGWMSVEGTDIDYPVMKGPDNDFYLSHDLDRKYDKYGNLIMDYNCTAEGISPQLIVYGHNVNSGKLFGELLNFKDQGYYSYHPVIMLETLEYGMMYEIFSVFVTSVDEAQTENEMFTTWNYTSEAEFDKMVDWAKSRTLYECKGNPQYGDEILTLVTCEHSRDEGRFVVMATSIPYESE